jgi:hypothetical protein
MDKFSIDYGIIAKGLNKRRVFKLSEVADRIEKVAFDVVRFKDDDDTTKLWQIQDTPDGKVIVAIYKDDDDAIKSESEWQALPDKHANVNIYRNGEPIVRLAAADFGIPKEEISLLCRWLPKKIAEDKRMQEYLISKAQATQVVTQDAPKQEPWQEEPLSTDTQADDDGDEDFEADCNDDDDDDGDEGVDDADDDPETGGVPGTLHPVPGT